MIQTQQQDHGGRSMFAWAGEVYLSIFVLFFRLSRWKGRMKSGTASMAVSVFLGMLIATIWAEAQIAFHQHINLNRWLAAGALASVFALNDYVLVAREVGTEFAQRFQRFATGKQIRLYVVAILIVIGSTAALFASISDYRHTFGVDSPVRDVK
jgi:hypothetical protein